MPAVRSVVKTVAPIMLVAVLSVGLLASSHGDEDEEEAVFVRTGPSIVDEVACQPSDFVARRIDEVVFPGMDSPAAALDQLLGESYPRLSSGDFEEEPMGEGWTQLLLREDEATVMVVDVIAAGGTWVVAGFVACNSVLMEGAGDAV